MRGPDEDGIEVVSVLVALTTSEDPQTTLQDIEPNGLNLYRTLTQQYLAKIMATGKNHLGLARGMDN